MRIKPWTAVAAAVPLVAGCAAGAAAGPSVAATTPARTAQPIVVAAPKIPAGTTAGYVLFDRQTGKIVAHRNAHRKFRSASVIKILIATDYLETHKSVPAADARLLKIMLRSSDDDAASTLWNRGGKGKIVQRMARKLRLGDTAPPPSSKPGFWGYASLSAHDIVTTYRYLLDTADPKVRDLILGHLRHATPCGTDGFDQFFGIPRALPKPWAVKQGWSGFGEVPPVKCSNVSGASASITNVALKAAQARVPDLGRPVLHTTGLVGKNERYIVALLTAHPAGGTWNDSVRRVTRLTSDLLKKIR